jgi:hypothetical protein
MTELEKYDQFVAELEAKHPDMFTQPYGGVAVSEGWWPIIKALCYCIDSHVKWVNRNAEKEEFACVPVVVTQIKEKFGGLRFYYDGGDAAVIGMVRMAEEMASIACEKCGAPGKLRSGGWITTLCDAHEEERQRIKAERNNGL